MKRIGCMALALVALSLSAASTSAQEDQFGEEVTVANEASISLPSSGQVTPEMWFYMQEYQRYQKPREAVRRKAEIRATQRQNRLAAQRWFGVSNLRPTANPIPFYGSYSPSWVGNTWNPYAWSGFGQPYVVYHRAD